MAARDRFDLIVAGAGVMGLGCALEEAQRGRRVAVVDPNPPGAKASWAAAGILVSRGARRALSPFRDFYLRSLALYPSWLERIESLSGVTVPFRRGGDYLLYDLGSAEGRKRLQSRLDQMAKEEAAEHEVLSAPPGFLVPHLGPGVYRILHFPHEAYVHNRELLRALALACARVGAEILAPASVSDLRAGGGAVSLRAGGRALEAGQLLIAAGTWSNDLLRPLGLEAPLVPVKGQMLRLPDFHGQGSLLHLQDDLYLVPREGDLIAGATSEPGVWDEACDESGLGTLEARLRAYFPGVRVDHQETWSGLRPRLRDRLPLMGWADPGRGVAICAGHYKCGISMAPLAAQCMSKLLRGERTPADLGPFDPRRAKGIADMSPEL